MALLRRPRGWPQTIAAVGLLQDLVARETDAVMEQTFDDEVIRRIVDTGGQFTTADVIRTARLRAGIITGRLSLELADDRAAVFMWAKSNLTYGALSVALAGWLGSALVLG